MSANNDFLLIVRMNESVKNVVRLARKINLLALNAILVSRRAGELALGYAVISNELRLFSKELTAVMDRLRGLSNESVQILSKQRRYSRFNHLMVAARANLTAHSIDVQCQTSNDKLIELSKELQGCYQQLKTVLESADEDSRFGTVISRSLKIEATYSAQYSPLLSQIASEFGDYIDGIPPLIHQAKRAMPR